MLNLNNSEGLKLIFAAIAALVVAYYLVNAIRRGLEAQEARASARLPAASAQLWHSL